MKYLYTLITFLLLVPCALHAQTPWNGTTSVPSLNGNIYSIGSAEELAWIAEQSQITDFTGYTIILEADIDLGGALEPAKKWQPIGNSTHAFNGELNGNNHVIRNLYISGNYLSAGLFAETGAQAVIHHLALAQGQIFTDGVNDIGCIAGIHRGTIHHCFNMAQILANNGNRIGGLVGTNDGTISYSYNTGLITKASTMVGGLAGWNTANGVLDWCYNTGYCLGAGTVGSLFGKNDAPDTQLTNVYFDQQTTRMDACGNSSTILENSLYAIVKTIDVKKKFADNDEWITTGSNAYPKLACFGDLTASQLSTYGIWLDANDLPMERAEAVGTPKEGNLPRKSFRLDHADGSVQWTSGNESIIHIKNSSQAETKRPCGNQEVYLTIMLGQDLKQIYTHVRGYETFDPGEMNSERIVCWKAQGVTLYNISGGKDPSGGKDDEQETPTDYQYMIIRYAVTFDTDSNKIYSPLDTVYKGHKDYQLYTLDTSEPGYFGFKRYVHDCQCTTTWTESPGWAHMMVREEFEPGSLYEKIDTIYGLPKDTVVLSKEDATGGGGEFTYGWSMRQLFVNYVTEEWIPGTKQTTIYDDNGDPIITSTCPVHFTIPGEYEYDRRVKEKNCHDSYLPSNNTHYFVVFDSLRAGSIAHFEDNLCTPDVNDTIQEILAPTGGNGKYRYRWLCNGKVIPNCDTTFFCLSNFTMTNGNTYVFRRQVKDDTGLMDWTTSEDSVSYTIYPSYKAGSVRHTENRSCYHKKDELNLRLQAIQKDAPQGEGGFEYCWLLYRSGEKNPFDTLRCDTANLDTTILLSSYSKLRLPASLVLRRAVKNTLCPSAWQVSIDSVVWHVGYEEKKNEIVSPCTAELPYLSTYYYKDGRTKDYSLSDNDSISFDDQTDDGCPLTYTVYCRAYKRPNVEVQPIVAACQSDTTLVLKYKVQEGKPNAYDVVFTTEAEAEGFVSIKGGTLPKENEIHIPMPAHAAYGKYSFSVVFYTASTAGTAGCMGEPQTLSFSMNMDGFVHRKWNDVVFVDNSDKNCEPNCDEDLTFVAYQWYKDGEPIPGATEQSYYEEGGLNGYYQVLMTASDGTIYRSCEYEMRPVLALDDVNAPVQLYPVPVSAGEQIQISADEDGEISVYNIQGACCFTTSLRSGKQTIKAPATPGIYLIRFASAYKRLFTCKLIVL
ncbi:MAG: T9SS type A sorting domain-containing protein [Paludibacteraceae bacterium]|nr:T9SS type A sorting domain-containing protein [Paludibacteraceae bacterium]